jgi:glutaredoxin 3
MVLYEGGDIMEITIYSTTTCPYCKMLMKYLDEKEIKYTKKLVDQDDEARDKMVEISGGFLGVPYTVVEKNGKIEKIIGFDKKKVNETLGIS